MNVTYFGQEVLCFFPAKNASYFSDLEAYLYSTHALEEGNFAHVVAGVFNISGAVKDSASSIRTGLPPALQVVRLASVHLPASITMWRSRNLSRPICNGRKSTDAW